MNKRFKAINKYVLVHICTASDGYIILLHFIGAMQYTLISNRCHNSFRAQGQSAQQSVPLVDTLYYTASNKYIHVIYVAGRFIGAFNHEVLGIFHLRARFFGACWAHV
jgi:hypothetical protein